MIISTYILLLDRFLGDDDIIIGFLLSIRFINKIKY